MSHEELVALLEKVQLAMFGRSIMNGVEIPIGKYVVGKDIPAGSYVLSATGEDVTIFVSTILPDGETPDIITSIESDESEKITLSDGMTLELISITKFTGMITIKSFAGLFAK